MRCSIRTLFCPALIIALLVSGCANNEPPRSKRQRAAAPTEKELLEMELQKLEEADDIAKTEVDGWYREAQELALRGVKVSETDLHDRMLRRFEPIRKSYEDFIARHPNYAPARLAYGSFLDDIGDEEGEFEQLDKAREIDPNNAAVWNNLANYYGHNGPVTNAFVYYEKAIAIDSQEPIYYHNFGTTVYLFRKDAREHYHIEEQQVFDKALELYSQAMKLDPTNYALATDVAMTYYGIKPLRADDAVRAWMNALTLAPELAERERVYLHLARIEMAAGRYPESRAHLALVSNPMHDVVKQRLARRLIESENGTNNVPASSGTELFSLTNAPPMEPQ